MTRVVDMHLHVFPDRLFDAVWRFFEGDDWRVHREYAAGIAQTLAAHGVWRAVALNYAHKPGVAASLNAFGEDLGAEYEVFLPFGSVHVDDADLDAQVARAIASPHLYGLKFQPLVQCYDLNDPRLDRCYAACQEAGFPLLVHAGTAPYPNPFVGLSHAQRLLARFPALRICFAHMGAFETEGFLALLDAYPQVVLDTAMIEVHTDLFDTTWRGDPEALRRHADRVCFGSDWPNVPYPYQEALDSVARFPLPAELRGALLGGNAARFLGLPTNEA